MWLDQSEEIIVYEHCIICQTIWDDRSGQVQIACLTSHHMEKVVFAIAGWAHLWCRNNVRHSICLLQPSTRAYLCTTQNTVQVWENCRQNCHVILFTLRQSREFLFTSVCVYDYHTALLVMNLCSWVTVRLLLEFSAAFRNFCPSPEECTGEKHLPANYMKSTFFLVQMFPLNDFIVKHTKDLSNLCVSPCWAS